MAEYFDRLVNEVDLSAELLLAEYADIFRVDEEAQVNERRSELIEAIRAVETKSFARLQQLVLEGRLTADINSLDDDRLYEFLLDQSCFIVTSECMDNTKEYASLAEATLGHLVIVEDGYVSSQTVDLIKELLPFVNKPKELSPDNIFFALTKNQVKIVSNFDIFLIR